MEHAWIGFIFIKQAAQEIDKGLAYLTNYVKRAFVGDNVGQLINLPVLTNIVGCRLGDVKKSGP